MRLGDAPRGAPAELGTAPSGIARPSAAGHVACGYQSKMRPGVEVRVEPRRVEQCCAPGPSACSACTAAAHGETTGIPRVRRSRRLIISASPATPTTYAELVEPYVITFTGAAASSSAASSTC